MASNQAPHSQVPYQASLQSSTASAQESSSSLLNSTAHSPPSKRDLAGWWRQFKRSTKKDGSVLAPQTPSGIFGIPLNVSIKYANVAISLTGDDGKSFIYGYVPIVVAKCGVFLKEKATDVEGIFRLSGSAKRIKDLQEIFNSPDRFGKGLDWTGYTVHDAANVLRRYLNQLPEPIVPLEFYERFRDPLRHRQGRPDGEEAAIQVDKEHGFDRDAAVATYQQLIKELPPLNRQLLLYILDLLTVFASKSDLNRMTAANLAAIFQPGMLSHPSHDMSPQEYKLSQDVMVFLIENQDNFLFGMTGTAADAQTVKNIQGGMYPQLQKTTIRRSASNASGGADSLRKYEALRRNMSVSSRHSRNSNGNVASPTTPTSNTMGGGSIGIHRSNTVPSKRAGGFSPPNTFTRQQPPSTPPSANLSPASHSLQASRSPSRSPQPHTHDTSRLVEQPETPLQQPESSPFVAKAEHLAPVAAIDATQIPLPADVEPTQPEQPTQDQPVGQVGQVNQSSQSVLPVQRAQRPMHIDAPPPPPMDAATPKPATTPTKERKLASLFAWTSPPSDKREDRQTNKLKKKRRIPGSASESAQSSTASLPGGSDETPMKPITSQPLSPQTMSSNLTSNSDGTPFVDESHVSTPKVSNPVSPPPPATQPSPTSTPSQSQTSLEVNPSSQHHHHSLTERMLRPPRSRTPSPNSYSVTDTSDLDESSKGDKKEKRRSWRFHLTGKKSED
ncbi:rho-GTPase-activating protein 5 [Arthroderma uncinatum]|uniref:rho-GTPase-activating protein 5 n=1 Tax=Arthroderma uncinatum TaxID=74035 RepID=UPI00144A841C|nr:rho-GTPase-activating protein 5 [Arthroderma uncinatum]KAF3482018.1 rho-GTPase-activating protein 5 [Arthroderma uncinatum]